MIHVSDKEAFLPVRTGVACLLAARRLGGDAFRWRTEEYEYRADVPAIDLLAGNADLRRGIDKGLSLAELTASWDEELARFLPLRKKHLLY